MTLLLLRHALKKSLRLEVAHCGNTKITVYKPVDIRCLRLPFFDVLVLALDIPEPISVERYQVVVLKIVNLEPKLVVYGDLNAKPENRTITRTITFPAGSNY